MLIDFEYLFWDKSFELEIWHTCYQHRGYLMKKNSWQKKKFSILAKGGKVGNSESSQLHMLVDFEYLFWGESFSFEILHTCYQIRNDLAKKLIITNQFFSCLGGIKIEGSAIFCHYHYKNS